MPKHVPPAQMQWLEAQQKLVVGAVETALEAASAAKAFTGTVAASGAVAALTALHDCIYVVASAMRLLLQFYIVVQPPKEKGNHEYTSAEAEANGVQRHICLHALVLISKH